MQLTDGVQLGQQWPDMVFLSHQPSLHSSVMCTVQNSTPPGGTGDRTSAFSVVLMTHSTLAPPPQTF